VSADEPAQIASFEIDYEGDSVFDDAAGSLEAVADGAFHHRYDLPFSLTAVLRLTNLLGEQSLFELPLTLAPGGKHPPHVDLTAVSGATGRAPYVFELRASITDEGTLAGLRWDLEGDGTAELEQDDLNAPSPYSDSFAGTYTDPGTYHPTLTVTDNDGLTASATLEIVVYDLDNAAPTAQLTADRRTGDTVPLAVTLDASGSTDAEGPIVKYEWDYNGDGEYDATSTEPTSTYGFSWKGDTWPAVRVTDESGTIATAVLSADPIHLDKGWTKVTLRDSELGTLGAVLPEGLSTQPYILPQEKSVIAAYQLNGKIVYQRGRRFLDFTGWTTPVDVATSAGIPEITQLVNLNTPHPAVAFTDRSTGTPVIKFTRAVVASGFGWTTPITALSGATLESFTTVNGKASIAASKILDGKIYLRQATESMGSQWGTIHTQDGGALSAVRDVELRTLPGGLAGVFYAKIDPLIPPSLAGFFFYYAQGTSQLIGWNRAVDVRHECCDLAFEVINGKPAVLMSIFDSFDSRNSGLVYRRSGNASLGTFSDGQTKEFRLGKSANFMDLALKGGNPWASFEAGGDLWAIRGATSTGSTWNAPETVDLEGAVKEASMVVVDEIPVILYTVVVAKFNPANPTRPTLVRRLKVAVWH
jgi:hypothetical protein